MPLTVPRRRSYCGRAKYHHARITLLLLHLAVVNYGCCEAAAAQKDSINVTELDCRMRKIALEHARYLQPWRLLDDDDRTFEQVRDALRLDEQCPEFIEEDSFTSYNSQRFRQEKLKDIQCETKTCIYVNPMKRLHLGDVPDGSFERPLSSAAEALKLSRSLPVSSYNKTIVFLPGIHFLSETLELDGRDSGLTLTSSASGKAWLSGAMEIPDDTVWRWDCSLNLKVRVANLTNLLQGFKVPKVQSLFSPNKRLVRARFPNGDPELDQWGYNSPDRLKYSIAADQVLEWHKPPPGVVPNFTFFDLRDNTDDPLRPIKNDSTMELYNVYASGSGGVCADVWGPAADSYWCSNASDGGWAEVDREAAVTGRLQIPVGMTYNTTNAIGERLKRWKDDAVGAIVHAWHSQSWAMHMFEIEAAVEEKGEFHFAPGGGKQGARNWCRCDQCGYAGRWCGQHQDPPDNTDDRLISGTWMVENVLMELDKKGEFFFDPVTKHLYVYPNVTSDEEATGDPMAGLRGLRFALLETLLQVRGAKDITISGLGFRDSSATFMSEWSAPSGGDWSLHRGGSLFLESVDSILVENCIFRRLDGNALFLSRRTRSVVVRRNIFEWLGESAIATWGETDDYNGLAANFPVGTVVEGNVMRELGIYEKQSSGIGHNKAARTLIHNNIIFNVPRAAINFNEMVGGGDVVKNNLIFNSCRESGDHGPINSWDRQPFLTNLRDGSPSFVPMRRTITSNLIFADNGASQGVDNDDGSSWFHIHHNVFYSADGFKMDYGGHDSLFEDNLVIRYPYKRTQSRPCVDLSGTFQPGHGHVVRRNTCLVPTNEVPIIQLESCNGINALLRDNVYMLPDSNATVACGYRDPPIAFERFQSIYHTEQGSSVQPSPDSATDIVKMLSAVLYPELIELMVTLDEEVVQ